MKSKSRKGKRREEAIEQIVDIMMRSLAKFSPGERVRRIGRIKQIFAQAGKAKQEHRGHRGTK